MGGMIGCWRHFGRVGGIGGPEMAEVVRIERRQVAQDRTHERVNAETLHSAPPSNPERERRWPLILETASLLVLELPGNRTVVSDLTTEAH